MNSNAADIAAGLGSKGGDTEGSQSDNASVVGSVASSDNNRFDRNQSILDASQGFDFALARQAITNEFREAMGDPSYTPNRNELRARVLARHDTYIKSNLEARANEIADLSASVASPGGTGLSLNFGSVSLTAIVFKLRDHQARVNEFTTQFDKLYESVVFAKTNRSINHPVHRHNIIVFEGIRRFGLALLRTAKIQKTDFEWHNDATLLTREPHDACSWRICWRSAITQRRGRHIASLSFCAPPRLSITIFAK